MEIRIFIDKAEAVEVHLIEWQHRKRDDNEQQATPEQSFAMVGHQLCDKVDEALHAQGLRYLFDG